MGAQIFKNKLDQDLFDKQGFLVKPFLDGHALETLNTFFDNNHDLKGEEGFNSGSYSADFDYKKRCSDLIVDVCTPVYEELFENFEAFGGAFLYKTPGKNSELSAHQDWTIVDEKEAVALNCWIPLCDITIHNGPIQILPGTQFSNIEVLRSPTLPFFFTGNEDLVLSELESMEVPAGTAVILNQSVIHYSPSNNSDEVRKAITAGVMTKGAEMIFYHKKNDIQVDKYRMEKDFLLKFENFIQDISTKPKYGEYIETINYSVPNYSRESLKKLIKSVKLSSGFQMKSGNPPSFFTRINNFLFAKK